MPTGCLGLCTGREDRASDLAALLDQSGWAEAGEGRMVSKRHLWSWVPLLQPSYWGPWRRQGMLSREGRKEEGIAPALQPREGGWVMYVYHLHTWSLGHREECPRNTDVLTSTSASRLWQRIQELNFRLRVCFPATKLGCTRLRSWACCHTCLEPMALHPAPRSQQK